MAKVLGKRTLRYAQKAAEASEKEKNSRKADAKRYQELEKVRRRKIGDKLIKLAQDDDAARHLLERIVEELRKERGGKVFDEWVMPGQPDPDAAPDGQNTDRDADSTDRSGNRETDPSDRPEPDSGDAEKAIVHDPVSNEKQKADKHVGWQARFKAAPDKTVTAGIRAESGRWNPHSQAWRGESPDGKLPEIKSLVENAGGEFSILPDELIPREQASTS